MGWKGLFGAVLRRLALAAAFSACMLVAPPAPAAEGIRDPFFASVPWAQWQSNGKRKQIRWDIEFFPVELSVHQRLLARVRIRLVPNPAHERTRRGGLAILIEYRDADGNVWQTHVPPADTDQERGPPEMTVYGNAFVLPGRYEVSVAVFDTGSREYSFASHRLHAKPVSNDPLPGSWRGLPEVEFLPANADPPDEWFLPSITSRMKIEAAPGRPVTLDVLVNATPGGSSAGSVSAMRRNMSVLIPALKVISQVDLHGGSINVRMLDLVRHRTAFEQHGVHTIDWPRLRTFFADTPPGIIDAASLAGYGRMRNFFFRQISRAEVGPGGGTTHVLLVLSGPAFFSQQQPLRVTVRKALPVECIYYMRYQPPEFLRRWRARPGFRSQIRPIAPLPEDEMELAARKIGARVFDVTSPGDFRRALATVIAQISRM